MAQTLLSQLGAAPVMLSLLYLAAFLHAAGKLRMLHGLSSTLDTKKLLAMSLLLTCLTRTMGFITIGVLNLHSIHLHGGGSTPSWGRDDPEERFYERTMMVLFDLPDFMIVSAYTLLSVVWAEAFLQSRRHWLSSRIYKRQLLLGYMIFNAALFAGQLLLYLLLFLPSFSESGVLGVIYLFLTSVNLLLPLLLLLLLSYLTFTFSGFPYKSAEAMLRMRRVGRVLMLWTAARVLWGLSALTAVLEYQQLVGSITSLREQVYSILVMVLFLSTELYPFVSALDNEVLLAMSADEAAPDRAMDAGSGEGGGVGGGNRGFMEYGGLGEPARSAPGRPVTMVSSALSAASEGNPTQPLLPRGRKGDSSLSLSSEGDLERTSVAGRRPPDYVAQAHAQLVRYGPRGQKVTDAYGTSASASGVTRTAL